MKSFYLSLVAACWMLGGASVAGAQAAKTPPLEQVLTAEIPAQAVQSILLDGGDGKVHIVAGADDKVRVQVRIAPKPPSKQDKMEATRRWFQASAYPKDGDIFKAVRIESRSKGGRLELGLTLAAGNRRHRITEEWSLAVPARAAVELQLGEADLDIAGIGGGVRLDLGVGHARLDIPVGDVAAKIGVGGVKIQTASDSIRKVRLASSVGKTSLWAHGARVRH